MAGAMEDFITQDDFLYEEELLKDPYSLKKWLTYLTERHQIGDFSRIKKISSQSDSRNFIYERALGVLPLSYKVWKMYLDERTERLGRLLQLYRDDVGEQNEGSVTLIATELAAINDCFERALQQLPYMPKLWLDYATFLMKQRRISFTRNVLDRALRALPFTLHDRIWTVYLKFATAIEGHVPKTAAEIWSRYWRVAADRSDPRIAARHVGCLLRCQFYDDAAALLVELAQSEPPSFTNEQVNMEEIMPGQYWQELCNLITQHGVAIKNTPVERVLRDAIERAMQRSNFSALQQRRDKDGPIHATGLFWNSLATWHIRQGRLDMARSIYDEAIKSVPTVRDFALVFDAYTKMEETLLSIELERRTHKRAKKDTGDNLDDRMVQLEALLEQRPFLLSNVRIRQQPNNVSIWQERIQLVKEKSHSDKDPVISAYEDAISNIHAKRAKGSLSSLWIEYGQFLEEMGDFEAAMGVLRRGTACEFSNVDELAAVWITLGELMVRNKDIPTALDVIAEAFVPPRGGKSDLPQNFIYKSLKLWNFYVDLEEARGLVEPTRTAYDRMIELGIATPQTLVNYASFLEGHKESSQEEAFRVYERGIAAFGYPVAFEIWNIYLPKYVTFYGPKGKIERIRDLFEQSLRGCPSGSCSPIYIEYAEMEEKYGSIRNALRVLERGAHNVAEEQKSKMFDMLLAKTLQNLGLPSQRSVFEDAISTLTSLFESVSMSIRYAALEANLGEYERARAVYAHASSSCDPRRFPALWSAWQEFETQHGTEATFRDMLRVKRAVQAKFTTDMMFVPATNQDGSEESNEKGEGI